MQGIARRIAAVWRCRLPPVYKDAFWRLQADAILGAAMRPYRCPCTAERVRGLPPVHSFWECQVAVRVRADLSAGAGAVVTMANVWLLLPPPGCHPFVWRLVAVLAVHAMDVGRRGLWRVLLGAGRVGGAVAPADIAAAGHAAVSCLHATLRAVLPAVAADQRCPVLPLGHPFLVTRNGALSVVPVV